MFRFANHFFVFLQWACFCSAVCLAGCAVKTGPEKRLQDAQWHQIRCENDKVDSCVQMGELYEKGGVRVRNLQVAKYFYHKACFAKSLAGCTALGRLHLQGMGGPQDIPSAMMLLQPCCESGSNEACTIISDYKKNQSIVTPVVSSPSRSLMEQYHQQCNMGEGDSCRALSALNNPKSTVHIQLEQQSCAQMNVSACYRLGNMYRTINKEIAKELFYSSCYLGEVHACQSFVELVPDDVNQYEKIRKVIWQGCSQGHGPSCGQLGDYYKNIIGDDELAIRWYHQGCVKQHKESCRMVSEEYLGSIFSAKPILKDDRKVLKMAIGEIYRYGEPSLNTQIGLWYSRANKIESAELFFKRSCEQNHLSSCMVYADFLHQNNRQNEADFLNEAICKSGEQSRCGNN